jgi:hypothetical protein
MTALVMGMMHIGCGTIAVHHHAMLIVSKISCHANRREWRQRYQQGHQ